MTLHVRKPSAEIVLDDQEENVSMLKIRQRRWRVAFRAIYFTRVLASLTRKVLDHNNGLLRHSRSYIAVNVNPGNDPLETQSFPAVDMKMISEMAREKSFESLRELGGVKQVAQVLESDPKSGVGGNGADLERRRKNLVLSHDFTC
ncbi:hypothetical protein EZV62_007197 [Acer yangbiense]|uniref:Uncharacterized protein n=1 Tax=Acer yangbiense TaxID=1000413 RepID=A0A5C7IB56_9ROSI|nr:hypothetical protein EZV62_007197 [Acer yangbiense]